MDGEQESTSQQEKPIEDRGATSETTDNPAKSDTKQHKQQEENVTQTKSENTNTAKQSTEFEENGDMQGNDKSEQKSKDDESPIRLTLEEDDNFHVDEVQFL